MPKGHVKPTKEELEANALKAAEEADKLKNAPHASPSPSPEAPSASPSPEAPSPSPSPEIPYKKKAIAQGKENIVLHGKQKKMNDAIDEANNIPDPTEEEMRVEYPEWDDMTETEKKTALKTIKNDRRFAILQRARASERDIEDWNTKVEVFAKDPKTLVSHPELEGKMDEFAMYAMGESRRGVALDILVSAFLHDETKTMKPKKGAMFPAGGGGRGGKPKPKTTKIGLDEARTLRQSNYPEYLKKLRAGEIDNSEITT